MTSRAMVYLGLTVALAACSKNSQETDALSRRRKQPESTKPASDTTQVRMERPDTSQYGKDMRQGEGGVAGK